MGGSKERNSNEIITDGQQQQQQQQQQQKEWRFGQITLKNLKEEAKETCWVQKRNENQLALATISWYQKICSQQSINWMEFVVVH